MHSHTRWLIPVSKWVITPVINGISRVNPLITVVITHLLSGMSHQVWLQVIAFWGGPIAGSMGKVHFLDTTGPYLTKVVYAYFDRISDSNYIFIYIYIYLQYIKHSKIHKMGMGQNSSPVNIAWIYGCFPDGKIKSLNVRNFVS